MEDGADICVKVSKLTKGVKRLDELKKIFFDEYGAEPEYFVKVPGRYVENIFVYFLFGL